MIVLDIVFCLAIIIIGFQFKNKFTLFNAYDKNLLNKLFIFHLIIGIGYHFYVSNSFSDSRGYWFLTNYNSYSFSDILQLRGTEIKTATAFLLLLNYFPAKVLNLSFFTGGLSYTILGYMGFVYFYAIIKENIPKLDWLRKIQIISFFPLLLFLPNLHFWSSGVSKDSILFFGISLFIYSLKSIKKRFLGLSIAILLSIFIRPHITLFLLVAFGISFATNRRFHVIKKIAIFIIFLGGMVAMYGYVMQFIQLESLDAETITNYSDTRASSLSRSRTESSVDTSSYSFPLKVFTFLYRPFFIDGLGFLGLVASFENLLLLSFTVKIILNKPFKAFKQAHFLLKGIFIFFLLGSFSFAIILGNLGIMLRQKTPFIIMLIIFGYWVLVYNKSRKV